MNEQLAAIRENDTLDESQFTAWAEQASRLPGRRM